MNNNFFILLWLLIYLVGCQKDKTENIYKYNINRNDFFVIDVVYNGKMYAVFDTLLKDNELTIVNKKDVSKLVFKNKLYYLNQKNQCPSQCEMIGADFFIEEYNRQIFGNLIYIKANNIKNQNIGEIYPIIKKRKFSGFLSKENDKINIYDSDLKKIKILKKCMNLEINNGYSGYFLKDELVYFFILNNNQICIESENQDFYTIQLDGIYSYSPISTVNNIMFLYKDINNSVELYMLDLITGLKTKIEYNNHEKLFFDKHSVSLFRFNQSTYFRGCDNLIYYGLLINGNVRNPFSKLLVLNKKEVVLDMDSERIKGVFNVDNNVILYRNNELIMVKDNRC